MNIISWNVNGIRALERSGNWSWLTKQSPVIFCLQEIKAEKEQLSPELAEPEGYYSFFSSSRERKGYSGVALYSKEEPKSIEIDVLPKKFNTQGRLIEATFKDFLLLNVYFPNGGNGKLEYKMGFYDAFLEHVEEQKKKHKHIIVCGDVNVAHEEVDIARPKENQNHVGFLPEEREWFSELLDHGYADVFRYLNPEKKDVYTYWDMKSRARDRNVGWRIDYFVVSNALLPKVENFKTHTQVYGSDHCPIELVLS